MVAAKITPDLVEEFLEPMNVISGATERRVAILHLTCTKATQADWLLLSDYLSDAEGAKVIDFFGINTSAGSSAIETLTYTQTATAANAKLVMSSATTGTVDVFVKYYKD